YYHKNALGSVTALSDRVGQVLEYYEYDPFGAVTFLDAAFGEIAESTVGNPYLFTGRRWDKEIGLYYYRNRHYDPEHGRFLQRDPLGYVDGMGLYEYVMGNPVGYLDPMGLNACQEFKKWLDRLQFALDVAGLFFDPADLLNGLIYSLREDNLNAGLS